MYSKILALGLLFVSTACDAAVLPPVASLTIAGHTFTDIKNLKTLMCQADAATNFCSFRAPNGTAGYTPSGSNKFKMVALRCQASSPAANQFGIGYSDNDVGYTTNTVPTNPVYIAGSSILFRIGPLPTDATFFEWAMESFQVPNGKYVLLAGDTTTVNYCFAYGYEVP